MTVIGLTGSSGSGKSTVASLLSDRQFHIIDCDTVARAVLRPDTTCLSDIFHTFGQNVKNEDGSLNRAALADIVFRDKKKLEQLNGIMYPQLRQISKNSWRSFLNQGIALSFSMLLPCLKAALINFVILRSACCRRMF